MVSEIVIHDEWNSTDWRYHSDIAVVVLIDSMLYSDTIQPVCLPQLSYDDVFGTGTVVGWGKSERSGYNNYDDTPNKVKLPIVNGTYCLTTFPLLANHASVSTFCGGYENKGKAPCLGDSGGGFYLKKASNNAWSINGIVSGALSDRNGGCDINKFQLYTSVARFTGWINKVVKETKKVVWIDVEFDCKPYE